MKDREIKPYLTAIHRKKPSYPLTRIFDFLSIDDRILDYGCGHGYDIFFLKYLGLDARGYDKYIKTHSEDNSIGEKYDVINCFYVLNVIEDRSERIEVLNTIKSMMTLETKVFIAVRSEHELKRQKGKVEEYKDGIVTSRNTFQKYFAKDELISLVREVFPLQNICEISANKNTIILRITEPFISQVEEEYDDSVFDFEGEITW